MASTDLNINLRLHDKASSGLQKFQLTFVDLAAKVYVAEQAFRVLNATLGGVIESATRQEDAIQRLNNAMELQGTFTEELSRRYQEFAKKMQQSTRFGDEAIEELMQQLISVGNVAPEMMERAAKAAIDFAAATGRDLKTAALTVGKAMTGFTGELSRYGIIIDQNIPKTEKAKAALEAMERQFGGFAQRDIKTFSGQLQQLKNQWGDFTEELGSFFIKSEIVENAVKKLTAILGHLSDKLRLVKERMTEGTEANLIARIEKVSKFIEAQQRALGTNLFGDREAQMERINQALEERKRLFEELIAIRQKDTEAVQQNTQAIDENAERDTTAIDQKKSDLQSFYDFKATLQSQERLAFEARMSEMTDLMNVFYEIQMQANKGVVQLAADALQTFHTGLSRAISDTIRGTKKAEEAFKQFGEAMVKTIVDFLAQKAVAFAISKAMGTAMQGFLNVMAAELASAWAPAAALASLATLGGNAAPAQAGILSTTALAQAVAIPRAFGGDDIVTRPTLFLAGENGPERATFTPLNGGGRDFHEGSGVTIQNINIYGNVDENSIEDIGEQIGYQIAEELRVARGA